MSDANQTPAVPQAPKTAGEFDAFLLLQGVIVLVLGGLAVGFLIRGDMQHAGEISVGLVGALQLQHKPRSPQS